MYISNTHMYVYTYIAYMYILHSEGYKYMCMYAYTYKIFSTIIYMFFMM